MTDPLLLAATVLAQKLAAIAPSTPPPTTLSSLISLEEQPLIRQMGLQFFGVRPDPNPNRVEFSQPPVGAPRSGSQLYRQRLLALRIGRLHTRLPADSFHTLWSQASRKPSYKQWRKLLLREAIAAARGQGNNSLNVIVGDSLSLWYPSDRLPQEQFWLNQSLSGDTTAHILRRLSYFAKTRPRMIYVMAGINDLKHGASDNQILWNLHQIIGRLQQAHPQAQIVLQSILPTRSVKFSNERIVQLNRKLEAIAQQTQAVYLDLYSPMTDSEGNLHPDLTTDGIHLNAKGYQTWQSALLKAEPKLEVAYRNHNSPT